MVKRRKMLIGLGSVAAGGVAVLGSSATNTIEANRSMTVTTAGDANAHLTLDANTGNDFVSTSGGEVVIDFSGSGVNMSGSTEVRSAFEMENSLDRTLYVWIANSMRNNDLSSSPNSFNFPVPGAAGAQGEAGLDVQFVAGTQSFMSLSSSGGKAALIDRESPLPGYGSPFASAEDNATMRTNNSNSSYTNFVSEGSAGYLELGSGEAVQVAARVVVDGDHFDGSVDSVNNDYVLFASSNESDISNPGSNTIEEVTRSVV